MTRLQKNKKREAQGFTFRREWAVQLEVLGERERSQVLRAMLVYYLHGLEADIKGRAKFVLDRIIDDINSELGRTFNTGDNG